MSGGTVWNLTANEIKGIGIVVMFGIAIVGAGLIPILLKRSVVEFAAGDAFSAGVLLVIGLMHLLPEADEILQTKHLAAGICAITYVILLILHNVSLKLFEMHSAPGTPGTESEEESTDIALQMKPHPNDEESCCAGAIPDQSVNAVILPCGDMHEHHDVGAVPVLSTSVMCLYVALGIHCVVEGFSAGAPAQAKTAGLNVVAIITHKLFAGFSLGQSMLAANYGMRSFWLMVLLFAIMSPIGLGIGWAIQFESHSTWVGVANAIAAGTFLNVACAEILPSLFHRNNKMWQKCIGLVLGASLIFLMLMLIPHTHEHDHHP